VGHWSGQDWALALGGAGVLITALLTSIGSLITSMVTLYRLGHVAAKVDGILDARVSAAEDTGNLAGRHELRTEQAVRRATAVDDNIRTLEAEHGNGGSGLSKKV
jgi:uncharacterized membrane protein YcjF (UPF0283 family)